ncbi:MAG: NACHT domain-containing protein [Cyanobacteria bacterium RM1_2_2]|nr:NACHT domain-containing protein [Cyanobacteria bacterium RM1_2_2]
MAIGRKVRASEAGIQKADELRIKRGWNRKSPAFALASDTSESTLGRFWGRKDLIRIENFINIYKALGTDDWEQYVDQSIDPSTEPTPEPLERIVDGVPKLGAFYGRDRELETLSQSILEHKVQVIGLLGMGGIGKTALAAKLVQRVQDQFDAVIWRSLRGTPPLSDFLIDLLETLSPDAVPASNRHRLIDELIGRLTQQRVLLVFDSWQSILGGESSGAYRPEYQDYSELLGQLWQQTHRSCVILTSREKQADFTIIGTAQPHKMVGLDVNAASQLLCSKGLICEQRHSNDLVNLYRGNPLALQLIASMIRDHFGGDISVFCVKALYLLMNYL